MRAVLFDLDGTLIEFHQEYLYQETHRIIGDLGFPPVERDVLEAAFSAFDYFRFVAEPERESFIEKFWASFDHNNFPKPKPFASSVRVLEDLLRREVKIAIVTSRLVPREELAGALEHTGFLPYVTHLEPRSSTDHHWSDKRTMIQSALDALGVAPAETALVGDIPPDIISAKQSGIGVAVAVLSGGILRDKLTEASPDIIIPDISYLISSLF